jgi:tetrahydromethanopterin S-methyltransferase subunit G
MGDETANLVLEHLRHIRGAMDSLHDDFQDLKHRMSTVERQIGHLMASEQAHYAAVSQRLDRLETRLDRVERRLDLTPAL